MPANTEPRYRRVVILNVHRKNVPERVRSLQKASGDPLRTAEWFFVSQRAARYGNGRAGEEPNGTRIRGRRDDGARVPRKPRRKRADTCTLQRDRHETDNTTRPQTGPRTQYPYRRRRRRRRVAFASSSLTKTTDPAVEEGERTISRIVDTVCNRIRMHLKKARNSMRLCTKRLQYIYALIRLKMMLVLKMKTYAPKSRMKHAKICYFRQNIQIYC